MDPADNRPSIPRQSLLANDSSTRLQTQHSANSSADCCCCGSECVEHGLSLRSLEKDVREAARVGQALLDRHEAYIAESEAERYRLGYQISQLKTANQNLEAQNAQLETENSALSNQLDDVNNTMHESNLQIHSLTATLHSTQRELEKLNRLVAKTEDLEAQLLDCEKEQAWLHATLTRSNEEERAALQRWRDSQRRVIELEQQMEDIEKEAREERSRHEEVEARIERRRAVEKELETSAALVTEERQETRSSGVVSNFVKDILQDNANMQLAMIELQDLLVCYKDANLVYGKEQQHDPTDVERHNRSSLSEELGADQEQTHSQVHVHHHYHPPSAEASQSQPRSRSQQTQKFKKRRPVLVSGRSTPANIARSPHRPSERHRSAAFTSSTVSSFDNRISKPERLSTQSMHSQFSFAISSGPSSPRSTSCCPSTIFEQDLADKSTEYSRPTSPESNAIWSPLTKPVHHNDHVFQPISLTSNLAEDDVHRTGIENSISTIRENGHNQISELQENELVEAGAVIIPAASPTRNVSPRRALHRTDSHTSLLSISGMDIHSTFPSLNPSPLRNQSLNFRQHSNAVLSTATASALKSGELNNRFMLNQTLRGTLGADGSEENKNHYTPLMDTFGKRVGGWLTARWASSAVPPEDSTKTSRSQKSAFVQPKKAERSSIPEIAEADPKRVNGHAETVPVNIPTKLLPEIDQKEKLSWSVSPRKLSHRPPGINQSGGLPPLPLPGGFRSIGRTPITKMVDAEALRECLEDEQSSGQPFGLIS